MMMDWKLVTHMFRVNPDPLMATLSLDVRFADRWYEAPVLYKMLMAADGVEPSTNQDVLRVSINDDGTIDIVDFSLPSDGARIRTALPQDAVPQWVMEAVSMLRITQDGTHVRDLGIKMSDTLYYVQIRSERDGCA